MINILIIDDDSVKIGDICSVIYGFEEISKDSIETVLEIRSAIHKLEEKQFDLVILDMKLPRIIGDKKINKGGVDILEAILKTNRIKKPTCIVGMTAYDSLVSENEEVLNNNLISVIKYDKSAIEWRDKLKIKIRYMLEWKKCILERIKISDNYDFDYAIITATDIEYNSVLCIEANWENYNIKNDCTIYKIGKYTINSKTYSIVLAKQSEMGMTASAFLSSKLIMNFRPYYLCMVGIAAGKKSKVKLGDLLIATESWDYGSGKLRETDDGSGHIFELEPHQISIDAKLKAIFSMDYRKWLAEIRNEWNKYPGNNMDRDISIFPGPVASGASVIQDEEIVRQFIDPQNRKLIGIDMETYGLYYAATNCSNPRPLFFSMKAVCDYADKEKRDEYQAYAAFVSAQFLKRLITILDV